MKKETLNVPIIHQPGQSLECSVASVQMLMHYRNDTISYKTLREELSEWINEKEIHIQGAAIYLARCGYNVRFTHHDPNVITQEIENITETGDVELAKTLNVIPDDDPATFRKRKLKLDTKYIKTGGKYSTAIPNHNLLNANLEEETPTLICISQKIWTANPTVKNNHYVVIVGKDNDDYLVNDPDPKQSSPYAVNKDKLLMAWYATGAYTLAASPK